MSWMASCPRSDAGPLHSLQPRKLPRHPSRSSQAHQHATSACAAQPSPQDKVLTGLMVKPGIPVGKAAKHPPRAASCSGREVRGDQEEEAPGAPSGGLRRADGAHQGQHQLCITEVHVGLESSLGTPVGGPPGVHGAPTHLLQP